MSQPSPDTLPIPLPRWPFLWPALGFLAMVPNTLNGLMQSWHGRPGGRILGLLLAVGYVFSGLAIALSILATRWRVLRFEGNELILQPWWSGLTSGWVLACYSRPLARLQKGGEIRIPITSHSLEWVGRTLLLHEVPDMGVILGRGAGAEAIARWLKARGWPDPVGR